MEKRPPRWTQQDIEYLQNSYGNVGINVLCKRLNRTQCAIKQKAKRLKLAMYKGRSGMTGREIAGALGISSKNITYWVEQRWLRARRIRYGPGQRHYFSIKIEDLWDFCEKHRNRINWSNYDRSLIPEPDWIEQEIARCSRTPMMYKAVSKEEITTVVKMRYSGSNWEDIADEIKRTPCAVEGIFRRHSYHK